MRNELDQMFQQAAQKPDPKTQAAQIAAQVAAQKGQAEIQKEQIAARSVIPVETLRTIAGVAVAIPAKRAIAARARRIAEIPARRTITVAVALAGEGFASAGMGFLVVGSRSVGFPG